MIRGGTANYRAAKPDLHKIKLPMQGETETAGK